MSQRYVNTASTPGGDGTTNNTTGTTRAYASLNEWEANEQADLVTATDIARVDCSGSTADTTKCEISGWTMNSSYYSHIVGDCASVAWSTSSYRYTVDGSASGYYYALRTLEDYGKFENLQLSVDFGAQTGSALVYVHGQSGTIGVDFNNCILKTHGTAASSATHVQALRINSTGGTANVKNVMAYDFASNTQYTETYRVQGGCTANFYNCAAINNNNGFLNNASTVTVVNCYAQGSITADFSGTFTSSDYNLSQDTTAPGSNSVVSTSLNWADAANDDYHLASTDTAAIGAGIGPSSDSNVLTADMDGDSRSGTTCDIGPDEYTTSYTTYTKTGSLDAYIQKQDILKTASMDARVVLAQSIQSAIQAQIMKVESVGYSQVILWTEDFTNAVWLTNGISSFYQGMSDPDGGNGATLLIPNTASTYHRAFQEFVAPGGSYQIVRRVKKYGDYPWVQLKLGASMGSLYRNVNLDTGALGNGYLSVNVTDLGGGWWELQTSVGTSGGSFGGTGIYLLPSDIAQTDYAWVPSGTFGWYDYHPQVNFSVYAEPYVKTTDTAYFAAPTVIDALVKKLDINISTSMDARLVTEFALTSIVDAIIQKTGLKTVSIDAIVFAEVLLTAAMDARVIKEYFVQAVVDAYLLKTVYVQTTIDAYLLNEPGHWFDGDSDDGSWSEKDASNGAWTPKSTGNGNWN